MIEDIVKGEKKNTIVVAKETFFQKTFLFWSMELTNITLDTK